MPIPPTTTTILDRQHGHLYKSHTLDNGYTVISGRFALPVAESAPTDPLELASWSPVTVVQAFAPYQTRTVVFDTRKEGAPPMIPSPESSGACTFLSGAVFFHGPSVTTSGVTHLWSVEGEYEFVLAVRSDPNDGFVLGTLPIPMQLDKDLATIYGGVQPQFGAVAHAGPTCRMGYGEAGGIDLQQSSYQYWSSTYFPPSLLNTGMLNGDGTPPPGY